VAERVVTSLDLLAIDESILNAAARLKPLELRTLDAIHLASAQALGEAVGAVVAYDTRLIEGARAARLSVVTPT
jgi:predicted nucleic acid-binding protein